MIKRIKVKNYEYRHPLGTITVQEAEIGVTKDGLRTLPAKEATRMSRLAAADFLQKTFEQLAPGETVEITADQVRALLAVIKLD
jgi:hypothetical protein